MMRLIVITDSPFTPREAERIRRLLDAGIDRIHLRKPQASEAEMRRLIEALPSSCYSRLTLQDRLPLAVEYGIGGIHLNGRNPEIPAAFRGVVSRSCHSLEELPAHPDETYLFLSPVFDSISKAGYRAAFTDEQLRQAAAQGIIGRRIVALGGIRPELLPQVNAYGFGGAALLGCVWRDTSPSGFRKTIADLRKYTNP